MSNPSRERVADVLALHIGCTYMEYVSCRCGNFETPRWLHHGDFEPSALPAYREHRLHVADALLALVKP